MTTEPFTQWGKKLPATTAKPEPSKPGMVVHSVYDISMYPGRPEIADYAAARTEDAWSSALAQMPDATVTFSELPEGQPMFDDPDDDLIDPPVSNL